MRKFIILLGASLGVAACKPSAETAAGNNEGANSTAAEAPKPAYCFFKDAETKDWAVKVDKGGNLVVSGKAYREDPRYKALLSPANVSGTQARVSPTITVNDTGFAAPGNWWALSETIPDSQQVATVTVECGGKTLATLAVPRKK